MDPTSNKFCNLNILTEKLWLFLLFNPYMEGMSMVKNLFQKHKVGIGWKVYDMKLFLGYKDRLVCPLIPALGQNKIMFVWNCLLPH